MEWWEGEREGGREGGGKKEGMNMGKRGMDVEREGGKVPTLMSFFYKELPYFLIIFQGAQRKVLDIMNTLGLSNTVMRLTEKRTEQVNTYSKLCTEKKII